MKGLRSVVSRLLIESVAKGQGHTIAQQFLHGPHMVRQTCRHSRCDWLVVYLHLFLGLDHGVATLTASVRDTNEDSFVLARSCYKFVPFL